MHTAHYSFEASIYYRAGQTTTIKNHKNENNNDNVDDDDDDASNSNQYSYKIYLLDNVIYHIKNTLKTTATLSLIISRL